MSFHFSHLKPFLNAILVYTIERRNKKADGPLRGEDPAAFLASGKRGTEVFQKITLIAICGLFATGLTAFAQVGAKRIEADERVARVLKEAELKYTVDSEGDYKLYTQVKEKRLQAVWLISETQKLGSIQVRQIWSIGYVSDEPFPAQLANRFLQENAKIKLGAWQIRHMGGKYVAVVAAQVGADADKFTLLTCMSAIATTADDMEIELTGKDTY